MAFELIYFKGCPNHLVLRELLQELKVTQVTEIDQDELAPSDSRRSFSSPTLTFGGKILLGGMATARACSYLDPETMRLAILSAKNS